MTPAALRAWFAAMAAQREPRADIADLLAKNRRILTDTPFEAVRHMLPGVDEARWLAMRGGIDLITEARRSDDEA